MHQVVRTGVLAPSMFLMEVEAPKVAEKRKPGQFVILRIGEKGERVPFTISDSDGGTGIAIAYPIAKALGVIGNKSISILGARTQELLFYEDEVKQISDELIVCTDDGSYGRKGLVTEMLKQIIDRGEDLKLVVAIGPVPMMKFVSLMTKEYEIPTIVSLNPIMIDGSGMCGCCRVVVDGQTKFACVDGPEFDAHKVDFDLLTKRLASYRDEEIESYEHYQHECKIGRG